MEALTIKRGKRCVEQGATMLVTGSYFFFKQEDYAKVTSLLKE